MPAAIRRPRLRSSSPRPIGADSSRFRPMRPGRCHSRPPRPHTARILVSVDPSTLPPGVYTARILIPIQPIRPMDLSSSHGLYRRGASTAARRIAAVVRLPLAIRVPTTMQRCSSKLRRWRPAAVGFDTIAPGSTRSRQPGSRRTISPSRHAEDFAEGMKPACTAPCCVSRRPPALTCQVPCMSRPWACFSQYGLQFEVRQGAGTALTKQISIINRGSDPSIGPPICCRAPLAQPQQSQWNIHHR
jgi:hypothetical protein